jgi:NAD kinase
MELEPGDRVHVCKSSHPLLLVMSRERGFFHVLREKLGWAGAETKEKQC